MFDRINNKKMD